MSGEANTVTMRVSSYVSPDGHPDPNLRGILLTDLKGLFHGNEGDLSDPFHDGEFHLSLSPWDQVDPRKTYIVITFRGKTRR